MVQLDDSHVRFAHPLLASICLWAGAGLETPCRAPHARGRGDGLRGAGPPSRRSPRRAPTLRIASELETAAEQAAARGAPPAAAELCELAAELTPDDPALARQRRVRAATYHRLAGNGEIAAAILEQLLTEVPSGVERSDVLLELVRTFTADLPTMLELSDEALAEAAHDDARSSRILAIRAWSHFLRSDVRSALIDARMALEKAERVGDAELIAGAIARVGQMETWAAEITPGLLERGAEMEERLGLALGFQTSPSVSLARLMTRLGEIQRSRVMSEELERKALARGDDGTRTLILWSLSEIEWLAGNWRQALDHAIAAQELGEQRFPPNRCLGGPRPSARGG